jgi:hypothetical protein
MEPLLQFVSGCRALRFFVGNLVFDVSCHERLAQRLAVRRLTGAI